MAKQKKKKVQGSDILASAHNIWLAGLGGLAVAEEQGGKLFAELVERGKELEVRLAKPMEQAGSSLRGTVKDVQRRAGETFRSIETASVGTALGKIGVPTRDEIARLTKRVEALTRQIGFGGASKKTAKKKTGAKKKTKKKPAAKKAGKSTARKAPKKKAAKKVR